MTSWWVDGVGAVVVAPAGDIDMAVATELSATITQALEAHPDAASLVFELGEVTFMDSTGINCFVVGIKAMMARSGTVTARHATPSVARLIRLVGLQERMTLLDAD